MDIIKDTAKEIYEEVRLFNIKLKKSRPELNEKTGKHMLTGFWWDCWDSSLDKVKTIHIKRTALLFYSDAYQPEPHIQHGLFVDERIKAGWTLADERLDYIFENDEIKWVGHDPYLQDFRLCSPAFQEWCIDRNKINEKIVKSKLKEFQKSL